jgi:hypothetical protein
LTKKSGKLKSPLKSFVLQAPAFKHGGFFILRTLNHNKKVKHC